MEKQDLNLDLVAANLLTFSDVFQSEYANTSTPIHNPLLRDTIGIARMVDETRKVPFGTSVDDLITIQSEEIIVFRTNFGEPFLTLSLVNNFATVFHDKLSFLDIFISLQAPASVISFKYFAFGVFAFFKPLIAASLLAWALFGIAFEENETIEARFINATLFILALKLAIAHRSFDVAISVTGRSFMSNVLVALIVQVALESILKMNILTVMLVKRGGLLSIVKEDSSFLALALTSKAIAASSKP